MLLPPAVVALLILTGCPSDPADQALDNDHEHPDAGTEDVPDAVNSTNSTNGSTPPPDPDQLDLLLVLDNSGAMCHFQHEFRETLRDRVDEMLARGLDLHLGITTTHPLNCDELSPGDPTYPAACDRETVARLGHLQSTPQPIPGFDSTCFHPVFGPDDPEVLADPDSAPFPADPDISSVKPVLDAIEFAVSCTENPSDWDHLIAPDDTTLRCSLPGTPGVDDSECEADVSIADHFPPQTAYREIPTVLRSKDYQNSDGTVDSSRFLEDLRCASAVGTRGYGYRQGLLAAVEAVSPALTGGPDAGIDTSPNAGFLRTTARTQLLLVSNQDDCTHDGSLDEATSCGINNCAIEEAHGDDGTIVPTAHLAESFLEHLSDSKDRTVTTDEIDIYSILGPEDRLDPDVVPTSCGTTPWIVDPTCTSALGRAWSSHRYREFIDHLGGPTLPASDICTGNYSLD